MPNEHLKKGIILYDTPGFGALDEEAIIPILNKAIQSSDAVVMLLDVSQGLKKGEKNFMENTLKSIPANKRYVALNKIDAVLDEDDDENEIQEQIDKVVNDTLKELSKMGNIPKEEIKHYEISAQTALTGYKKNREELLEMSGFPQFEEDLWKDLVAKKEEIFNDRAELYTKITDSIESLIDKEIESFTKTKQDLDNLLQNTKAQKLELEKLLEELKERMQKKRGDNFK